MQIFKSRQLYCCCRCDDSLSQSESVGVGMEEQSSTSLQYGSAAI